MKIRIDRRMKLILLQALHSGELDPYNLPEIYPDYCRQEDRKAELFTDDDIVFHAEEMIQLAVYNRVDLNELISVANDWIRYYPKPLTKEQAVEFYKNHFKKINENGKKYL